MDTNGMPDEEELSELEVSLQTAGWQLVGFIPSGREKVPGVYRAERLGTRVVTTSSTTSKGLLVAVESFERHEAVSKEDVHDIRREDDLDE